MKSESENFRLPLKKMPFHLHVKIQIRMFFAHIRRILVQLRWQQYAFAVSIFVIISVAGYFGIGAYAYSSSHVAPGHFLYTMKRDMETDNLAKADTPSDRIALYFTFSEKRLDEAEYLLDKEPALASMFIPSASAMDEDIDTSEAGVVGELMVESHNFQTLAIQELGYSSDTEQFEDLVDRAYSEKLKQDDQLESIQEKLQRDAVKNVLLQVRNSQKYNWEQIEILRNQLRENQNIPQNTIRNFQVDPIWMRPISEQIGERKVPRSMILKAEVLSRLHVLENMRHYNIPETEIKNLFQEVYSDLEDGNVQQARSTIQEFSEKWVPEEDRMMNMSFRKSVAERLLQRMENFPEEDTERISEYLEEGNVERAMRELYRLRRQGMQIQEGKN